MDWWQIALLILVVGGVALWAHIRFWVARLSRMTRYDEQHRIATSDGSAFELRRLKPSTPSELPPVLLVHGIAINHRNLDPDENLSIARQLREDGRDVWLLTLRCGRPDLSLAEIRLSGFEALVTRDLPEAAQEVLRRCDSSQLDYLGFSMGGMLAYAGLGRSLPAAWVRKVVLIGAPARVQAIVPGLGWLCRLPAWFYSWSLPLHALAQATAFAAEWFGTPIHALTVQLANSAKGYVRVLLVDAVQSIPAPLLRDFGLWAYSGGVVRLSDGLDVLEGLRTASQPLLMVAATRDLLAPPHVMQVAFDAWGSQCAETQKALRVVGKSAGQPLDYGHGDLAIGARSATEVNAPVRAFLNC